MNNLTLYIWLAVAAVLFAFLWYKGYLLRLTHYVRGTKEELRKCTWPTRQELRESTVVVMISILLLAIFTSVADQVLIFALGLLYR